MNPTTSKSFYHKCRFRTSAPLPTFHAISRCEPHDRDRPDAKPVGVTVERQSAKTDSSSEYEDEKAIRVLVIDDSPFMLKTLSTLLENRPHFYLIGTAINGYQALRKVVELVPDVVLMGSPLQGMPGLEVIRQMRACAPGPRIILVSADDRPQSRAAAQAAGVDVFVSKRHLIVQLPHALQALFPRQKH